MKSPVKSIEAADESTLVEWRRAAFKFINNHIFISVGIFGFTSWLLFSYGVFLSETASGTGNIKSFKDAIWLGLVTMLTIGYGDHYPLSEQGRLCASGLMFTGIISTGILTAKVSSIFLTQAILERRHRVNEHALKDHLIICGFKENMADLIFHIMKENTSLTAEQIVIVADVDPERLEAVWQNEQLRDVQFIKGEQQLKNVIIKARPSRAQRILILADRTPHSGGSLPTPAEADAKTIMTAITLHSLARDTIVTAEIIDPSLAEHLTLAGVSDILYSREYSRMMLGNAMSGTGISNIMFDLLDSESGARIVTEDIPASYVGKTYRELRNYFDDNHSHGIVVGILKNAGNHHQIKERALREAQKTANVSAMIQGLNQAKKIRVNAPVFHPKPDSVVPENSLAIVIKINEEQPEQFFRAG